MTYNFDFAVSATISATVVEEMITKVVEQQTGRKVKKVTFKTKNVGGGFRDDHTTVFDGCVVDFDEVAERTVYSNGSHRGDLR